MKKEKEGNRFKSKIGGQALIEGIMMRGLGTAAMACRMPSGEIEVETWSIKTGKNAPWYTKAPFIRGCINFFISMKEGIRCTMKSSEKQITEDDEEEELSKVEQWLYDKLSAKFGDNFIDKLLPVIMVVTVVITFALSLVVFKGGPVFTANLLIKAGMPDTDFSRSVTEGFVRVILITGYMFGISFMPSIKTVFQYHGAEHKAIACYEARKKLTVQNIAAHPRFHPRCGTSFILLVLILSVIVGLFLPRDNMWVRFGLQLLFLLPEASIAYEIIKIAGRYDNIITRFISAPGIWLQHITTREPTEKQIEVAIAALTPCLPKMKLKTNDKVRYKKL
ncbi:MAG: DUF1385 domain-containing protein [Oscillospiraceae bacterium]|nr:DUF1385 domain-containing protein [Oscillospiraceae bacterium]